MAAVQTGECPGAPANRPVAPRAAGRSMRRSTKPWVAKSPSLPGPHDHSLDLCNGLSSRACVRCNELGEHPEIGFRILAREFTQISLEPIEAAPIEANFDGRRNDRIADDQRVCHPRERQ